MRSVKTVIWLAALMVLSSCDPLMLRNLFGPTNYYVSGLEISHDQRLSPVGYRSLFEPTSAGSYYFFFHGANLTSVDHFERSPGDPLWHRLLYLETKLDGRLDRTVKSDVLLIGDFGTVSAHKTCFYNRPVEGGYNAVKIWFFSSGYLSAYDSPTVLARAPEVVPPLTSVSLIRIINAQSNYILVSADYEATGERGSYQIVAAKGGKIFPTNDQVAFSLHSEDPRIRKYGIPPRLDIEQYRSSHRLRLPPITWPEETVWLIQFYDFGKLIQQQQLRDGVPISSRWLQPSTTKEEQTIGAECDARFRQQRSMGLPTTAY